MYKFADSIQKVIEKCERDINHKGYMENEIQLDDVANTTIKAYWELYGNSCSPEYKVIVVYIYQYGDRQVRYIVEESKTKL